MPAGVVSVEELVENGKVTARINVDRSRIRPHGENVLRQHIHLMTVGRAGTARTVAARTHRLCPLQSAQLRGDKGMADATLWRLSPSYEDCQLRKHFLAGEPQRRFVVQPFISIRETRA